MVFICGARQVGKTILARAVSKQFNKAVYFNWDNPQHKQTIIKQTWLPLNYILIQRETDWMNFLNLTDFPNHFWHRNSVN